MIADGQRRRLLAGLLAAGACAATRGAVAHEGHALPPKGESAPGRTRVKLADVELVDQRRRRGMLSRDVIRGRIVVANFVFTTCSSVCPVISSAFSRAQKQVPPALRADTRFVSLTVDPLGDTPERMATLAERYGGEDIWRWLTGRAENVEAALKGFGAYTARPDDHVPMAVVGDPQRDAWYRFMGIPEPAQLVKLVQELHVQRATGGRS